MRVEQLLPQVIQAVVSERHQAGHYCGFIISLRNALLAITREQYGMALVASRVPMRCPQGRAIQAMRASTALHQTSGPVTSAASTAS